jgi:ferritin-like metal-binding protein YciE
MPTHETRSIYITGLRNAHAMENQALSIMRPQAGRIENYPEVAQRLSQHIAETEDQLRRLEQLLDAEGDDKSTLKDLALSVAGGMAALGHTTASDEILKNSFANFAFENYEAAAYKSLIALAGNLGETSAVAVLTQSLEEELAMARWLDDNIGAVTLRYASLREAGDTAKK